MYRRAVERQPELLEAAPVPAAGYGKHSRKAVYKSLQRIPAGAGPNAARGD